MGSSCGYIGLGTHKVLIGTCTNNNSQCCLIPRINQPSAILVDGGVGGGVLRNGAISLSVLCLDYEGGNWVSKTISSVGSYTQEQTILFNNQMAGNSCTRGMHTT